MKAFGRAVYWACLLVVVIGSSAWAEELPKLEPYQVTSSLDGTEQAGLVWAPESAKTERTPMLVFLHSWSGDYRQQNGKWQEAAVKEGWIYLHPNFRGRNDHPEACGSKWARRDILDAIDWAVEHYQVDESRLYLAGSSGGGHMSMLMGAYHPERFSAVSAWVGISNLFEWHAFHVKEGKPQRYAVMIEKCVGGSPGDSDAVDAQLRERSPIFHLANAKGLPIHLHAGASDGFAGSVPTTHTLKAFNVLAKVNGGETIAEEQVEALWKTQGKAGEADPQVDPVYGRKIFFHREAGPAEVTLFEGGHESIPAAGIAYLKQHVRKTKSTK